MLGDLMDWPDFLIHVRQYVELAATALAAGCAAGVPLGVLAARLPALRGLILGAANLGRVVPSLALLTFMLPLFGVGFLPALAAITLLAVAPIVITTDVALRGVPAAARDVARGMGMTSAQTFVRVEWPLAFPVVFSGIRTAATEVVASAVLASFIGAGGLGDYIQSGLQANVPAQLWTGAIAVAALALLTEFALAVCCFAHEDARPLSLNRKTAIALMLAAGALPSCSSRRPGVIRVGSKNFTEDIVVAEIYAAALEGVGLTVERHMNLGSTQIATEAMLRADIDVYPEYTGTALIDVLHLPPMRDAAALLTRVRSEYRKRYDLLWLSPSPANDSQGIATTRAVSGRYNLRTLSQCARLAPQLRFAAIPEFLARADALPGLQKYYGGFNFKSVASYAIGLQYAALTGGSADVATAFTTDAQLVSNDFVVLEDDRHFWPPYNIAPVVRAQVLRTNTRIASVLNRIAPHLTDAAVRRLNQQVDLQKMDPTDAAAQFLRSI